MGYSVRYCSLTTWRNTIMYVREFVALIRNVCEPSDEIFIITKEGITDNITIKKEKDRNIYIDARIKTK